MTSKRMRLAAAALLSASVLAGCTDDAQRGDCNARIRLDGTSFRVHNELNQAAPIGRELGTGEVIDCGTAEDAPSVDKVKVFAVEGIDDQIAVVVKDGQWSGVYVVEGLSRSAWPEQLESR